MSVLLNMIPWPYNKRYKVSTCKALLEKIIDDAQSLIETKKNNIYACRENISKRLLTPLEHVAHTMVLNIFDENNMIMLLQHIICFCEAVARHLFVESPREVPLDLKEAIASLCHVGARYSELPDLKKLLSQFSRKYGKEFIANVTKVKADCGVKEKILELLLVPKPPVEERNKLLKDIAEQFHVEWDPETGKTWELQLMKYYSMSHVNMETAPDMMSPYI